MLAFPLLFFLAIFSLSGVIGRAAGEVLMRGMNEEPGLQTDTLVSAMFSLDVM